MDKIIKYTHNRVTSNVSLIGVPLEIITIEHGAKEACKFEKFENRIAEYYMSWNSIWCKTVKYA